jgi:hypothetical protein
VAEPGGQQRQPRGHVAAVAVPAGQGSDREGVPLMRNSA